MASIFYVILTSLKCNIVHSQGLEKFFFVCVVAYFCGSQDFLQVIIQHTFMKNNFISQNLSSTKIWFQYEEFPSKVMLFKILCSTQQEPAKLTMPRAAAQKRGERKLLIALPFSPCSPRLPLPITHAFFPQLQCEREQKENNAGILFLTFLGFIFFLLF